MRLKILALTFMCLALATGAEANRAWIGTKLAFPVPVRNLGDAQLGIDANYHHVWSEYQEVPNFSAVTLGTHILFGW